MKICFVGWADNVHLERWAGYFAREGNDVTVISFSGLGRYPESVKQYSLGLGNRGMGWKVLRLRYLLWRLKPDVVHVHWAHFASPVSQAWSGPLVVTAWGSDIYRFTEAPVVRELVRGLNAACAITCDSEDLAERIKQIMGLNKDNIHVIQWGVEVNTFFPADPEPGLISRLGIVGKHVIFSPRGFLPVYNQDVIVSAFVIVLGEFPDAILLMRDYGTNNAVQRTIQERIEHLGIAHAVRILGVVPYEQMRDIYRTAAISVSVPFSDATPMSLLEAMACGSVPIVSDLPSLREWVDDGWNGYLVSPSDVQGLADRITTVLKNPQLATVFAQRNVKIVQERADQTAHMTRMHEIYRKVLEGNCRDKRSRDATFTLFSSTAILSLDISIDAVGLLIAVDSILRASAGLS